MEGTRGDFGNSFDDWGNRFTSNSGSPVIQAIIPVRFQDRFVAVSRFSTPIFQSDGRVCPISDPDPWRVVRKDFWNRWVDTTHEFRANRFPARELAPQGYITGAAALEIYRGSAYPEEFRGNVLTGEPAGNLVIRSVLQRDGVAFRARRGTRGREFIASTDNWFRPVNLVNGPDGCLYCPCARSKTTDFESVRLQQPSGWAGGRSA